MKSINIKLSLAENVKSFVNVVSRYPYDMDLRAGRHVVRVVNLKEKRKVRLPSYSRKFQR